MPTFYLFRYASIFVDFFRGLILSSIRIVIYLGDTSSVLTSVRLSFIWLAF